ncbi:hypothetical protein [Reichenbachiella sp.]|uniref:hypothetical protein n=1 Tax=Reichenbachiella sp. TaxID=2184521 RepID=UPI003BB1884A
MRYSSVVLILLVFACVNSRQRHPMVENSLNVSCKQNSIKSHKLCVTVLDSINKKIFFQLLSHGREQLSDTIYYSEVFWYDEQHIVIRKFQGFADKVSGKNYKDQLVSIINPSIDEK